MEDTDFDYEADFDETDVEDMESDIEINDETDMESVIKIDEEAEVESDIEIDEDSDVELDLENSEDDFDSLPYEIQRELVDIEGFREGLSLEEGDKDILQEAGAYGDLKKLEDMEGYEHHHMLAQSMVDADPSKLPAISLLAEDHRMTSSYGGRQNSRYTSSIDPCDVSDTYKNEIMNMIDEGRYGEAVRDEVLEIRRDFGTKYDGAIDKFLDYYSDYIKENGIPSSKRE